MLRHDYRDVIAGAVLVALGLFVGVYALEHYPLGSLRQMGPGMFPASLGFVLAGLGVLVILPALFRTGQIERPDFRSLLAVGAGVLGFALTINSFGMVPGIVLLTVCSAPADDKLGVIGTAVLAAVLSLLAYLIFHVGLGITIEPFKWPF
jgi:predicted secreted protein